jgi:hypothetical protein
MLSFHELWSLRKAHWPTVYVRHAYYTGLSRSGALQGWEQHIHRRIVAAACVDRNVFAPASGSMPQRLHLLHLMTLCGGYAQHMCHSVWRAKQSKEQG